MRDDNHEVTTDSSPSEQAFENTVDDAETVRLAQPIEGEGKSKSKSEEWLRFAPFRSEGIRRLTLGTIGTGKTVSAMATASRVLDAVPDSRIVVVNPIPGEYDPLAHTLSEKNRTSDTGDIPSAKRFRVGDGDTLSLSASDLPAVSIIEPPESAALPECQESLEQAVENIVGELSGADEQWPTYLILDEAHCIFRSDSAFGIRDVSRAQQEHGALAVQVVTPGLEGGQFEAAIEDDENEHSPLRLFDTMDLYYSPHEPRKRLGLSPEDIEFLRWAVPGGGSTATVRKAAPTGLCKTPDEDWQRVRYTLTEHEAESSINPLNVEPLDSDSAPHDNGGTYS